MSNTPNDSNLKQDSVDSEIKADVSAADTVVRKEPNFDTEAAKSTVVDEPVKGPARHMMPLTFYNDGYSISIKNPELGRQFPFSLYTPELIHADSMLKSDRQWVRHLDLPNGSKLGPRYPRVASTGGEVTGKAALELLRRASGTGGELTYELLKTGIRITVIPPTEEKFINLEYSLAQAATAIGMSTTGLLLNARSGVFSEALVRLALEHVIECNLKCGADERVDVLLDVIDAEDYGTLIWGVLASKFPNGHPWVFTCTSSECTHEREATIMFSRMLWHDRARLTERQLTILKSTAAQITLELIEEYKSEFSRTGRTITFESGVEVVLKSATMREYLSTAKAWVEEIERMYNMSMSSHTTEASRNAYLEQVVQARRMLKYEHLVSEIRIPLEREGDYASITDRATITASLTDLSGLDSNFNVFETGVFTYLEDNAISVVGYPNQECPKCDFEPDYGEGRFRAIVPVAIDRVLFTLVQQRNTVLRELAAS